MKYTILLILFLQNSISEKKIASQADPAGVTDTRITIGKSGIIVHTKGMGTVPVVFVSGLGEDHHTWQEVQDSVAGFAMTFSYDRSGLGKSSYHNEKKDLRSIAGELHQLLVLTKLARPFILVGHSLGCQIVKEYASLHPKDVKGIVFIDPGYNEENLRAVVPETTWQQRENALRQYLPSFNPAQKQELKYANRSAALSDSIRLDKSIPVILFTATKINPGFPLSAEELRVKIKTHELWLRSMPGAKHIIVPGSRHYIHNDEPPIVVEAIRTLLLR